MTNGLARFAAGACILALAACSSDSDDSARISALEADLAKAKSELETANTALSDHQADTAARRLYFDLATNRRVHVRNAAERRAADGSTLTLEFSGPEQHRANIELTRAAEQAPGQLGEWSGERYEGTSDLEGSPPATTVAVLYRAPMGAASYLQFGWWQTESTNSAGRSWFSSFGAVTTPTGGEALTFVEDVADLTGTATFAGHAAGLFAISNPARNNNASGEFTADATLTVDFDDGSASGMIDNFSAGGEQKEWTVSLLRQEFAPGTPVGVFSSPPANGRAEVEWALSTDENTPGTSGANWWWAWMVADAADANAMGAIGQFNAEYQSIGRMHGTFGAKKQ